MTKLNYEKARRRPRNTRGAADRVYTGRATPKQMKFLADLGYRGDQNLGALEASGHIDILLEQRRKARQAD